MLRQTLKKAAKREPKKGQNRGASKKTKPAKRQWQPNLKPLVPAILVGTCVVSLIGIGVKLEAIFNAPVANVSIQGAFKRLNQDVLREVVEPTVVGGYLTVDLVHIKTQLEHLAWVKHASVKRQWPHTIEISVTEQQPYVRWGETQLLNSQAEIFAPDSVDALGLAAVSGPQGTEKKVLKRYEHYQQQMLDFGLSIDEYILDKKGAERIRLTNGVELVMGRGDGDSKLRRLFAVYQDQLAHRVNRISKIDMRYSNGLAVEWRESVADVGDLSVR